MDAYKEAFSLIKNNMAKAMIGKEKAIELILIALIARGHVLIEDVPGIGKTTLVHSLAASLNLQYRRIQFTPDLMPADITGFSILNRETNTFEFKAGPVLTNLLLADEINRSSPKTQSSLLEVMQERQITVDGKTYLLANPFMVLATQNPIEQHGTYPLPEAQLDRFMFKVDLGYPKAEEEIEILSINSETNTKLSELKAVASAEIIGKMQKAVDSIFVSDAVKKYIVEIARRTRKDPAIELGASPRASIMLMRSAMAKALIEGRDFVIPDDARFLASNVLAHRIVLKSRYRIERKRSETVIKALLEQIKVNDH